uniref:trafficking protein particle complex subunit 9 isoform X2 n=1 Tax=Myxine glutinosa TaxID=7769 RepID=UPI00359002C1
MTEPDYTQSAEDHQCLLVVVKPLGSISKSNFSCVFNKISSVEQATLQDSHRATWIRYKQYYPPENNDWGDFQAHRRVVGLIAVAEARGTQELALIFESFDGLRGEYGTCLYNWRMFVFGLTGEVVEQNRTDVDFVGDYERLDGLTRTVEEFTSSLFIVLESKRLDRASEKAGDKMPLLCVPFEKKDFVGLDTDSRNYRKRCQGRMRKHVGDLNLQAGLLHEALVNYHIAVETLRSINDFLWLAAALEGLCVASVVSHYGTTCMTTKARHQGASTQAEREQRSRTGSLTTNGIGGDPSLEIGRAKNCLSPDDIVEKYREAISFYAKYRQAAVIELEACIKAVRVLALQKKRSEAADFLQNAIYIHVDVTEDERIQRYSVLSELYERIGFRRKAAFFKRISAMQCVRAALPEPGWKACYELLLDTLQGYNISLDNPQSSTESHHGWPAVQLRILHELVYSAQRMGNPALSVHHLTFLLHSMLDFLSEQEKKEVSQTLERYAASCRGHSTTLEIRESLKVQPIALSKLPIVRSMKLINLPPNLRPVKLKSGDGLSTPISSSSPFIYSPIVVQQRREQRANQIDFQWVQGDVCEVQLMVYNPMPFELRVENMGLLTSGVEFESLPAALSLPAESGLYPVTLVGVPKIPGPITIAGYHTEVFGIPSRCMLQNLPHCKVMCSTVEVVPALPLTQLTTSLPRCSGLIAPSTLGDVCCNAVVRLFNGETQEVSVQLENIGKQPVESVELEVTYNHQQGDSGTCGMTWDTQELQKLIPMQPGSLVDLTLSIHANFDFSNTDGSLADTQDEMSTAPGTPFSSPARRVTRPHKEYHTPGGTPPEQNGRLGPSPLKIQEAVLLVHYTGGPGATAGYSRRLSLSILIEVEPSVVFTNLTAVPATSSQRCHLVIDVQNQMEHEVQLQSIHNDDLLLRPHENKRMAAQLHRLNGSTDGTGSPRGLQRAEAEAVCRQLGLRWLILSNGRKGEASVARVVSPAVLEQLRLAPLQWDVEVGGLTCIGEELVSTGVGKPLAVTIRLTNGTAVPAGPFCLELRPFLDFHNGLQDCALKSVAVFLGSNSSHLPQIQPAGVATFHCSCLFLFPGDFLLDIQFQDGTGQFPASWLCLPTVHVHVSEQPA